MGSMDYKIAGKYDI